MANYAKFRGTIIDDRTGASLSDSAAKLYYNSSGASPSSTNTIPIGSTSSYRTLGTTQKMIFGTRSSISAEYSFVSISVTIISPSGNVVASNNFTSDPTGNSNSSWDITSILTGAGATTSQKPAIIEVTLHLRSSQPTPRYTLYYNANGGSPTPSSQTVEEGTRVTLAAAPSKPDYAFDGWLIDGVKYAAETEYIINSNVTAVAQWLENAYEISFNKNASDVSGDNIPPFAVTQGSSCILPGAVLWARDKYAFIGWATTSGGSVEYSAGDPFTPTANTILYAVWSRDRGEGAQPNYWKQTSKTSSVECTEWYALNLCSNIPTREITVEYLTRNLGARSGRRYTFNPDRRPNPTISREYNNSAGVATTSSVTLSQNGREGSDVPKQALVTIPGDYVRYYSYIRENNSSDAYYYADEASVNTSFDDLELTAPEVENYDFVGWFTIGEAAPSYTKDPTNADYTIRVSSDRRLPFGTVFSAANSICIENTVTANQVIRRYANMLQAQYIGKLVTVLFDSTGGEIDEFYREVRYIETYGTLPTPVRRGYTFAGWYTQAEGGTRVTASTVVETVTDHVLYAHWTKTVSNTIQVVFTDPTKTNPTAVREIARGTTMKLPWVNSGLGWTTPAGYSLDQAATWKDYSTGQTFANNGDISSVTASILRLSLLLTLQECTVTFDANGGTSDLSTMVVSAGATIGALPKARLSGKIFEGWYTAREGGEKVTTSLIVNSSITLYAHFKTSTPVSWITVKVTD